ncbi:hypothetical protein THAOC_10124 [Thalassiosira oceanica]|uniref:Uncharacterized protein n=1 Tax=Thalassiosira oceanica TaxID=159749 RepID=K0T5W5_THAOC|nr:hypothetical protein THAOC_10124 [Thalassiosira oceanica]|eukprot:EJK68676.1 hypothetical protein THAOC_10124 [Thalassiosira oceanica]
MSASRHQHLVVVGGPPGRRGSPAAQSRAGCLFTAAVSENARTDDGRRGWGGLEGKVAGLLGLTASLDLSPAWMDPQRASGVPLRGSALAYCKTTRAWLRRAAIRCNPSCRPRGERSGPPPDNEGTPSTTPEGVIPGAESPRCPSGPIPAPIGFVSGSQRFPPVWCSGGSQVSRWPAASVDRPQDCPRGPCGAVGASGQPIRPRLRCT